MTTNVPIYGMTYKQRLRMQSQLMSRSMSDPRFLYFSGDMTAFQHKVQDILRQPNPYTQAHLTIIGKQVKQADMCCAVATMMFGCLIIPLFFTCCDWWRRMVSAIWQLPVTAYQDLQKILLNPELTKVTMFIADSAFDSQKAQVLINILSRSNIKEFNFRNCAGCLDYLNGQFSTWRLNMKPIKMLPMKSVCAWGNETLED